MRTVTRLQLSEQVKYHLLGAFTTWPSEKRSRHFPAECYIRPFVVAREYSRTERDSLVVFTAVEMFVYYHFNQQRLQLHEHNNQLLQFNRKTWMR